MRKLLLILLLAIGAAAYLAVERGALPLVASGADVTADDALARAYRDRRSDVQVQGEGVVTRILADDVDRSRHQRFILRLETGQTLLVAHNIDLAPRIHALRVGDRVAFAGEFEWNPKGGVVHWTHHDPEGRHRGGWLEHDGQKYE